ncbi:MAG: tetratricopeptide repeat protein [Burkholderiales bacterium]|nr:tetratricopeptide repeat protein [Burkholderiales bacterium]
MSLLLDALKRAEQEKLARQGTGHEQAHASPAAETVAAPAAPEPAKRRPLELESHDSPPRAAPAQAASPSPAPATARDREGAKTVFAAKQAAPAPAAPAPGGKKAILAIVIGAVLLAIAGGGYVWYEVNRTPGPMARGPVPSAPRPVTPAPQPAPAVATPTAPPSATAPGPGAASPAAPAPRKDAVPPVAVLKPGGAEDAPAKAKPEPKAAEQLVMRLLKDAADARPAPPLKLTRTIEPPRVNPEVSRGYEALKRGDPAAARRHYEAALAADPASIDAHLGLATAAARGGDRATATRHYRRVLGLDPKNPSAVAGLAALADLTRPEGLEGQLRADLSRYPQSPALHFTLGNLYASQSRWTEAQAAYFEAYRLDPESADLAYNLAVSLDQLGQSRLAADFYQRALAASGRQAVQFDKGQVSRRIAELKP